MHEYAVTGRRKHSTQIQIVLNEPSRIEFELGNGKGCSMVVTRVSKEMHHSSGGGERAKPRACKMSSVGEGGAAVGGEGAWSADAVAWRKPRPG